MRNRLSEMNMVSSGHDHRGSILNEFLKVESNHECPNHRNHCLEHQFLTRLTMKDVNADWYTLLKLIYEHTVFYFRKLARVERIRTIIWNDFIIWSKDLTSLIRIDDSDAREIKILKDWWTVWNLWLSNFEASISIISTTETQINYANCPGEGCIDVN